MNVSRIQLSNFRSWPDVELDIAPGVTLLSGPNGAGKSSLIDAMLFAMFGATSGAEALIRRGTDVATVVVEISSDAGDLQVTRTIRRSGNRATVSLDVRQHGDGENSLWPLSGATVTETQLILDGLLGVSREVLQASAFSTQHGGGAFTEAAPRDRKRVFAEILALGFWDELAADAKAEKRAADDAAAIARAELERLDGAGERVAAAVTAMETSRAVEALTHSNETAAELEAQRLAAEAEAAREARRQHAAAVEAEQRARADHERAGVERQAADEALARAKAAAANAPSVEDAEALVAETSGAHAEAEHWHASCVEAARVHAEQLAEASRSLAETQAERARAAKKVEEIEQHYGWDLLMGTEEAEHPPCPECGKPLDQPGDESVIERARENHRTALAAVTAAEHPINHAHAEIMRLDAVTLAPIPDATLIAARSAAQAAATALAEAQTIQSLAGSIDAAQQRADQARERWLETDEALRNANYQIDAVASTEGIDAETQHAGAVMLLNEARSAHSAAATDLALAEEAVKLTERQAAEETAARERLETATRESAIAKHLADGFSPTGVPAMIIDSVLGDLADEANRVLAELASPIRVDLRSQRVTQKGDVVDALDIIVTLDAMEAPYETLSGGERTRVQLALRAALTRLLASKRGARVRLLVVDEPAGLDATGAEHLAAVLNEFVAAGVFDTILLVTHHDALADLIGRVVRIEKSSDGCSRLVGAAVEAAA